MYVCLSFSDDYVTPLTAYYGALSSESENIHDVYDGDAATCAQLVAPADSQGWIAVALSTAGSDVTVIRVVIVMAAGQCIAM